MKTDQFGGVIRMVGGAVIVATAIVGGMSLAANSAGAQSPQGSGATAGAGESSPAKTAPAVIGLLIGSGEGLSFKMAQDLASVVDDGATRRLLLTLGSGGVQDVIDLVSRPGIDVAIVQSDVLDDARESKATPGIENVSYIAKLQSEELHVLARPAIQKIEDLAHLKVELVGGAAFTGQAVLDLFHVQVVPLYDDAETALAKLQAAQIAAIFYIAPKPAPLFRSLTASTNFGLHFLNVPLPVGRTPYSPRQLTTADYPELIGVDGPILTAGVDMVMVAANLAPKSDRYRSVVNFVDAFFDALPQLRQEPHNPTWTKVDLAAPLPGWKRFPEATARLEQKTAPAAGGGGYGSTQAAARPPAVPPAAKPAETITLPSGHTFVEMVSLPGGSFEMGSDDDASEKPIHSVTVEPFAIARSPVTIRQWLECVAAGACPSVHAGEAADDAAPVTNVSWDDAQAFVAWLSDVTKRQYRLPSEAEWEYAARAGTQTRYWWGNEAKRGMADCRGCGDAAEPHHLLKVASFPPNPFGLTDMSGTVAEWVADCWHKNYQGAPSTTSPWVERDCRQHVLRGGSWEDDAGEARSASRDPYDTWVRYVTHGFRPARSDQVQSTATLTQPSKGEIR
jgi:formylglycine-generating enzyme required for sulfatase activity